MKRAVFVRFFLSFTAICIFLLTRNSCFASVENWTALSLEELMDVKVSMVSRTPKKIMDTPAAVYVISSEELRRSGATSIAEAIRFVPGMFVAHVDANKWAINARGSNNRFSGDFLVMIDGRTVYSPTFSGVWWDVQDTVLEDIDHIEIVRGPGGTTWGANAVNGVINIVSKSAYATKGGLLSVESGTSDGQILSYRQGGNLNNNGAYRFYVKGFNRPDFHNLPGEEADDKFHQRRVGFRADWELSRNRSMTLSADAYNGGGRERNRLPDLLDPTQAVKTGSSSRVSGSNLLFSLRQKKSSNEETRLQIYFDRVQRDDVLHDVAIDTLDLDFQHNFVPGKNQEMVYGFGFRSVKQVYGDREFLTSSDKNSTVNLTSFFLQDQFTLKPDKLFLTIGSKFYHHPYVGFESQPSARLLWLPEARHAFWTAFSESRRIPSAFDRSSQSTWEAFSPDPVTGLPIVVKFSGSHDCKSEVMKGKELGYRFIPNHKFSLDLAYFEHEYLRQIDVFWGSPVPILLPPAPHIDITATFKNSGRVIFRGLEASLKWSPIDSIKVDAGFTSNLKKEFDTFSYGNSPARQWFLRTFYRFHDNWEFNTSFERVGACFSFSNLAEVPAPVEIAAYSRLDASFCWKPKNNLEIMFGGQNLLEKWHQEFGQTLTELPTEIPRNYYLKATWLFK
ncbi:MAG: TonB-dependent receptor [Candidatus Riflebacteria bacterium]|nr:TonB-dependent receptor [Candidatus Riflebacteria bacterium]